MDFVKNALLCKYCCNSTNDLFDGKGGKLIIFTHYYGFFDTINGVHFLLDHMDTNAISNSNVKWSFIGAGDYDITRFDGPLCHLFNIDKEKEIYLFFETFFSKKSCDHFSKRIILKDRKERIIEEIKKGNNVVMFNNGTKLSRRLFEIINELQMENIYLINMKISSIDVHEKISSFAYDRNILMNIKTLLEYAINISKKEITMNMDVQKRLLNPNDFEAYQMISDDFYNNNK